MTLSINSIIISILVLNILVSLKIIINILGVLIGVAYFTLVERKLMATIQRRKGPNVVGFQGLFQPLSDGLKLLVKETILPSNADLLLFAIAPIITFFLALIGWSVIPVGLTLVLADINLGVVYLLAVSSLGVYGIIISGWSSNSKYAFLGALRSAAQMVSYEISISFILMTITVSAGSLNLSTIVAAQEHIWYIVPHFPAFVLFFVSSLAETNRHPFDLPEAEAELVSGYNVEYSAMGFALFFLGEYANMLLMSAFITLLFFGGWLAPFNTDLIPGPVWFALKMCIFVFLFIVMRACLPRYRYDQLMSLGWKVCMPLSLGWLILTACILTTFDWLPN